MRLGSYGKSKSPFIGASFSYGVDTPSTDDGGSDGGWFKSLLDSSTKNGQSSIIDPVTPNPGAPKLTLPPVTTSVGPAGSASLFQPSMTRSPKRPVYADSTNEATDVVEDDFFYSADDVADQNFITANRTPVLVAGGVLVLAGLIYFGTKKGRA